MGYQRLAPWKTWTEAHGSFGEQRFIWGCCFRGACLFCIYFPSTKKKLISIQCFSTRCSAGSQLGKAEYALHCMQECPASPRRCVAVLHGLPRARAPGTSDPRSRSAERTCRTIFATNQNNKHETLCRILIPRIGFRNRLLRSDLSESNCDCHDNSHSQPARLTIIF